MIVKSYFMFQMFCPNCSTELGPRSNCYRFCPECGKSLGTASRPGSAAAGTLAEPAASSTSVAGPLNYDNFVSMQSVKAKERSSHFKPSKKRKLKNVKVRVVLTKNIIVEAAIDFGEISAVCGCKHQPQQRFILL